MRTYEIDAVKKIAQEMLEKLLPSSVYIKIKYLRDITPLETISVGNMIDLRAGENIEMKKGEFKIIPMGVAMELPKGFFAEVYPRSSTFKKYHILMANSVGVIDSAYCGDDDEWGFVAYAVEDTTIPKDTRIAQFRIVKSQPSITFKIVEHLGNKARGGFGSTGEK